MLRSVSDLLLAYLLYMHAQAIATACCLTVNRTTSFLVDHRSVAVDPCTISAFESDLFGWTVWIWIQMRVACLCAEMLTCAGTDALLPDAKATAPT